MSQKKIRWNIIFEDDDILVIDKPAGWLSIPDRYDPEKQNLVSSILQYREEIFVVHRLDRDTSGLILFAKNESAHKILNEQFLERKVIKTYIAFVDGIVSEEKFEVNAPIQLSQLGRVKIQKTGKESLTEFVCVKHWTQFSKVICKPKTGRLHQIRIHLQHTGHPLMIDPMYGKRKAFFISSIKRKKFNLKKDTVERPLVSRQTLHASELEFKHPTSGEMVRFEAPVPKDLRALEKQLDKWGGV